MATESTLECPHCKAAVGVGSWIDAAKMSWPNQGWAYADCSACGRGSHLELGDGSLAIGDVDGGPGPCFFESSRVSVPGLKVASQSRAITCTLDGKTTNIAAKK